MLVGKQVTLRPLRQSDLQNYYDLDSDVRHVGMYWPLSIQSERAVRSRFEKNGFWSAEYSVFLITDHEDEPLGYLGFYPGAPYQNTREIGYRLFRTDDHGHGYITEAVSLAVAYIFASKPLDRVQAAVIVGNTASRRVLEKAGFVKEGILRSVVFVRGKNLDMELYSILRDEAKPLDQLLAPLP